MGPEFWKPQAETHLKKCSEFVSPACDPVPTDSCCGVIPCSFCLEFAAYDGSVFGVAEFAEDGWYGTINGAAFVAYWERNYETEECEFIVTVNDLEIYRDDCYGGISCRDPSGSAEATIGDETALLTWAKIEHRPLEYVIDEDTHCRTHFCGTCECSCECICVTIRDYLGFPVANGELCDVSYPCDGPVWEGEVGIYSLSIALGRDQYDECIITATLDGVEQASVLVTGCAEMFAEITLEDGGSIVVACKVCACTVTCSEGCCVPYHIEDPYPNGVLDNIPFSLTSDCIDLDGETGIFTPLVPTSSPRGTCGFCASYHGDWAGVVPGEFATGLEDPGNPGGCLMSPCSVSVCLVLECNDQEDAIVGQNACCSKMRLWVGTESTQVGDIGERPQEPIVSCTSWRKFAPTMCECDETGGIIATFPVSFSLDCEPIVGGFCDGQANCCQVSCAFDVVI